MVQLKKWQVFIVILFSILGILFSVPNFVKSTTLSKFPSFLPNEQIVLGLDLQGGSYLLLEVDTESVIKENLNSLADEIRLMLRKKKISYSDFNIDEKDIFINLKDKNKEAILIENLNKFSNDIQFNTVENDIFKIRFLPQKLKNIEKIAILQSIEVVRRRVDEFGTKEPTIQQQGKNRILLELPGITDPERLKNLLGQTAKLSFQIVDEDFSIEELKLGKTKPGIIILPSDKLNSKLAYGYIESNALLNIFLDIGALPKPV